jgi:hypothetical protein
LIVAVPALLALIKAVAGTLLFGFIRAKATLETLARILALWVAGRVGVVLRVLTGFARLVLPIGVVAVLLTLLIAILLTLLIGVALTILTVLTVGTVALVALRVGFLPGPVLPVGLLAGTVTVLNLAVAVGPGTIRRTDCATLEGFEEFAADFIRGGTLPPLAALPGALTPPRESVPGACAPSRTTGGVSRSGEEVSGFSGRVAVTAWASAPGVPGANDTTNGKTTNASAITISSAGRAGNSPLRTMFSAKPRRRLAKP